VLIAPAGLRTIGCEFAAALESDQFHACQTMIEVHTVSMVAMN